MRDAQCCSTCGAALSVLGESTPMCVPCAYGFALSHQSTEAFPTEAGADGEMVGPYRLLQVLGEGGMGVVWEALQEQPVRRRVALKRIRHGMDSAQVLARFESERQALALMSHPHIAQVLDAGCSAEGQPYFAMEYVDGIPLTLYCDQRELSVPERIELFLSVCAAIQHAHQKGVIHRDIKPSNILVQTEAGRPVPKVIDFGVAKAMAGQLTERTLVTRIGQAIGTLEYMSPEQAGPAGFDVDTRTDVHALGVVLYELLTGRLPFEAAEGDEDELRRRIREDDPVLPSARVSGLGRAAGEIAHHRKTHAAALAKSLRGDLDWIVMKALAKDRGRRYGSPEELAADLRRHQASEPVLAGPPGATYRLSKLIRRHRMGVAVASAVAASLVAIATISLIQSRQVARERDRANREARVAGASLEFLTGIFRVSDPSQARGETITAREVLDRGAADIKRDLSQAPEVQAELMMTIGKVYRNLGLYQKAQPLIEEALQGRRSLLGAEAPETLRSATESARLQLLQGRLKEAESTQREALEIQRRVLGSEHSDTLDSMSGLASVYRAQGRYAEAEALHRETLAIRKQVLGTGHPDTLASMHNLASTLRAQGRYPEAETLHRKTLDSRRAVLGPEHPETLNSINSLANVLSVQDRHGEAEALYRANLEIQRRVLGPDHRDTLFSMSNLANAYRAQGRYAETEALRREVLGIQTRVLGAEHPDTLSTVYNLANLQSAQGRHREAEAGHGKALDLRKRVLGAEHPDTLRSMYALAHARSGLGRHEDAERLMREALEVQKRVLGTEHPDTLRSLYGLACEAALQGARVDAFQFLHEGVEHGFSDVKSLLEDAAMASLRDDPGFAPIVAAAKSNQQRSSGTK